MLHNTKSNLKKSQEIIFEQITNSIQELQIDTMNERIAMQMTQNDNFEYIKQEIKQTNYTIQQTQLTNQMQNIVQSFVRVFICFNKTPSSED